MQTFMLMTKLSPEVVAKMKERAAVGRAWLDMVYEKCPGVKFISHYGLLGKYDFVDIYEAPDADRPPFRIIQGYTLGTMRAYQG
jgi:uncharacterized protein with GYD domain